MIKPSGYTRQMDMLIVLTMIRISGKSRSRYRRIEMKKWLSDAIQDAVLLVLIGICIGGGVELGFTAVMAMIL